MNQNWNAEDYSSKFSFVCKYGADVLKLIEGNVHTVIDLGCGTGTLTNALAEKGCSVLGLDASDDMLTKARINYPALTFMKADAVNFSVDAQVDAVFSNAVLHWIDKIRQPMMIKCVYEALKYGGQFVFEMGGCGCAGIIHERLAEVFAAHGQEYVMPFFFPTIGEYSVLLENAGFTVRYAVLFDRPTQLTGSDGLYDWIRMFVTNPFIGISEEESECIRREVSESLRDKLFSDGKWYVDYVRLRMRAVKEITRENV